MASFWDEGLVTSIYRLQVVAKQTGDAGFISRAAALQTRATNMSFPVFQAISIKGDALQLGYELAAATSAGSTNAPGALSTGDTITGATVLWNGGKANVLFDEDNTIGGQVGTPSQEALVSGDAAANVSAFADDVSSSASDLFKKFGGPVASKATHIMYTLAVLVVLLLFFYVYERARA